MNLVQIQERLKDLPLQAIMSYANGQNPQVPPYLALGEMNRRKKMEQQAAQPPKATVKENIEQEVGMMAMQKMRQPQMMGQPAMQPQAPQAPQPQAMPQPEAEMAMAAGGVARLPMHLDYASGGIVAFANPEGNQLVKDEAARELQEAQDRLDSYSNKTYKNLSERQKDTAAIQAAKADVARAEAKLAGIETSGMDTGAAGALGKSMATPAAAPAAPANTVSEAQATALAGPQAAVPPKAVPAPAPAAPPPAALNTGIATNLQKQNAMANPVAPAMSEAQKFQEGILKGTGMQALPPEYAPPKQAPLAEDYLKYLTDREQKSREDALKFDKREEARSKRDFWNSLIQGAEASRGQRGIGALIGGTGRSLGEAATAADERRSSFEKAQQELLDNNAKTRFEIANLRRAEERGDAQAVYNSKVKLVELGNQRVQLQGQVANNMAGNESAERVARANNLTQLEVARINRASADRPGETERLMTQYAEIKRTKGDAAAEEFMKTIERVKTGSRGETAQQKLNVQRQALAEKLPIYQMAISTYTNAKDPKAKADALAKIKEIEALHGIKSEDASGGIDLSLWSNPRVSSK